MSSRHTTMGQVTFMERGNPESHYPESRVLIIMTGGTICMQPSADGLIPMTGFLENAMAPRPSFNDYSTPSSKLRLGSVSCSSQGA